MCTECHHCVGGHDHCVVIGSGDLCQLVHRIDAQLPLPASSLLVATQNKNGSLGDGDAAGMQDSWSNSILDIVAMLGEGVSGVVEVLWDKWTGHQFACKTIITHEGPLKQLCVHVAIEQQGQADDGVVQGKEPGHHWGADPMEEGLHGREGCTSVGGGSAWPLFALSFLPSFLTVIWGSGTHLAGHSQGTFMGTTKYMAVQIVAPKHIMGREYTTCADVWSMGLEDEDSYRDM
ncbi:hypothetical protein F5148DRAFT_1145475 [Russula earlei]|uniref:Uncharacterized protein n=1 Tax=Russula earlei TaxID=71964 RepID=A0ACC0UR30_9AGAM|nr:hypothetical protein F5148DRAFT_1145475 [Russula earlei]